MKICIYIGIIAFLGVFANPVSVHGNSGYLGEILKIESKSQELQLEKIELINYNLSNSQSKNTFQKFEGLHGYLKAYFLQEYKKGDIDYYKMNDIISSFEDFSFYANRVFYYSKQKEIFGDRSDLHDELIKAHTNMRSSYYKLIISLR